MSLEEGVVGALRAGVGRPLLSGDSTAPARGCGRPVGRGRARLRSARWLAGSVGRSVGRAGPDLAPLCPRRELAPVRREHRAPPHAAAPLPARAALQERAGQVRRLQRARQRAERHALSAKVMQRQNRARESHPRRPKHQGSFIYQPCQRQFNY